MTTKCSQQSDNNPTDPIDRVEVKNSVKWYITGLSEENISDANLDIIIAKCIEKYEDSAVYECDVTYCAVMSTIDYLRRAVWVKDGDDNIGALKRHREKEGDVEEEMEWHSVSGDSSDNGWEKLYDYYLNNPSVICPCLEEERGNTFGLIAIGGTQQDKYVENNYSGNARTVWDTNSIGNRYSYRREQRRRKSNNRSKYWSRR